MVMGYNKCMLSILFVTLFLLVTVMIKNYTIMGSYNVFGIFVVCCRLTKSLNV